LTRRKLITFKNSILSHFICAIIPQRPKSLEMPQKCLFKRVLLPAFDFQHVYLAILWKRNTCPKSARVSTMAPSVA